MSPTNASAVRAWIARLVLIALGAALGRFAAPRPVEWAERVPAPPPAEEFVPTHGWVRDPAAIEANRDPARTLQFDATPAGAAEAGEGTVLLYRAVRKVGRVPDLAYPNVNQQSVGCCVGCGFKHGADVVQATAILQGGEFDWRPVSAEVIYAGSRVQVGGGRISGDGSVGAWAARWVKEYGLVPMDRHGPHDLSAFSPARARAWGASGVPAELERLARQHPVRGTALVTSAAQARRALQQGYPVAVCSDQGFGLERDRDGFARPQGSWAHCMCVLGWRGGARPGFLLLNSWGDRAHTGPVWPADMPPAAFWVDEPVLDRMVRQGDSFALSGVRGFPARVPLPDWFVGAPVEPCARFALLRKERVSW